MNALRHISAVAAAAFAASLSFSLVACDDSSSASGDDVLGSSDSGTALGSSGSGDVPGSSGSVPAGMEDLPPDIASTYYSFFYGEACDEGSLRNTVKSVDGSEYAFQCVEGKWEVSEYVSNPKCLTPNAQFEPECVLQECNAEIEGLVEHMTPGSNPGYQSNVEYYRCEQGEWRQVEASAACDTAGVSVGDVCDMRLAYGGAKYGHDSFNCYKYLGDGAWAAFATDVWISDSCYTVQEGETASPDSTDEQ